MWSWIAGDAGRRKICGCQRIEVGGKIAVRGRAFVTF